MHLNFFKVLFLSLLSFSTLSCSSGSPIGPVGREFVVTFGGDVNFAQSLVSPSPDTVFTSSVLPLENTTAFLRHELTGDLNFINSETVVSAQDHDIQDKEFVFRSHPEQFDHLVDIGVNLFSLANNHAYDHGRPGMEATLEYFNRVAEVRGDILFAGVDVQGVATAPQIQTINGVRVAFSAIGIGNPQFTPRSDAVGMSMFNAAGHWEQVLEGLAASDADFRILSIHLGAENVNTVNAAELRLVQRALEEGRVNLLLGHHPHVTRGVAADPDRGQAVFHSLGNLLFVGGASRDHLPVGWDYGLFGKAYFQVTRSGVRLTAIEVLPLLGVNVAPRPMDPERVGATLEHLSALSRQTDGDRGVQFTQLQSDPTRGIACFGGPYGSAARQLCAN